MNNSITRGFIDSASLSQIVQFLDLGFKSNYELSVKTMYEVTCVFLLTDFQHVAPTWIKQSNIVSDAQDHLLNQLYEKMIVKPFPKVKPEDTLILETNVRNWVNDEDNFNNLKKALEKLLSDEYNYNPWIDWVARSGALLSHSKLNHGLFEESITDLISKLLSLSEREVTDLQSKSSKENFIVNIVKERDDVFNTVCKAYMFSALLRSSFHLEFANKNDLHLFYHPFRSYISERTKTTTLPIEPTNTAQEVAAKIINSALNQSTLIEKVDTYVDNLFRVRSNINSGRISLQQANNNEVVCKNAEDISRIAGIPLANKNYERVIGFLISMGIGRLLVPIKILSETILPDIINKRIEDINASRRISNWIYTLREKIGLLPSGLLKRDYGAK